MSKARELQPGDRVTYVAMPFYDHDMKGTFLEMTSLNHFKVRHDCGRIIEHQNRWELRYIPERKGKK